MANEMETERGEGWVLFAGVMFAVVGVLNFLWGLSAIANSHIFINGNHFDIDHRQAWGWTVLILGALELLIAYGIWTRQQWARWSGVVIAGIHAIVVLADMQAYPWWSLALFSVDVLIIYGLVAHGGRSRTTAT